MRSISVVIPTYNEAATIRAAIESAHRHHPVQIIVSDGNSDDLTREIAQGTLDGRVLVINEATGRGRQLAAGARYATGDVILFLHSDNSLLCNASEQMENAGWPIWGGFEQRINDRRWRFRFLEIGNAMRVRWTSRVFGDQALFVDRSTYESVGGFDEVDLMEDVMLSAKLKPIAPAVLLPGKLVVDPRRWNQTGIIRQTILNWRIQLAFARGVPPSTLRQWYR